MCVILYKASVVFCLFSNRRVINTEHNSSYIVCFTLYTIIVAVSFKIPTCSNRTSRDAPQKSLDPPRIDDRYFITEYKVWGGICY